MQHIIHQQKIIIRSNGTGAAQDWHRKIDANFQQKLMQRLGELFDTLMPPDRIWRIDALHMDLEGVAWEGDGEKFIGQVVDTCRNVLSGIGDPRVSYLTPVEKKSMAEGSLGALLFFLENGRLPWYSTVKDIGRWESEMIAGFRESQWLALADWLRKSLVPDGVSGMLRDLGLRPDPGSPVLRRLIRQFSDAFLRKLLLEGPGIPARPGIPSGQNESFLAATGRDSVGRLEQWEGLLGALLSATDGDSGILI